jgi:hypothetical protein
MVIRRRSTHPSQRLARQSVELALAAPQVVMHRLSRMAQGGANPSLADRREFARMGPEKVLAFYQSGVAFWGELLRAQLRWNQSLFANGWAMALGARPKLLPLHDARGAARALSAAVAPLHVTAVANARRLGGRKRRTMRA